MYMHEGKKLPVFKPYLLYEFFAPESVSESPKASKNGTRGHADAHPHHETHLNPEKLTV